MDKSSVLNKYFGHESFRPGQEEIIDALLNGRDVLAVMPTGSGKSICYQVPGMLLEGITLVISPLISLMKDQVTALNAAGMPAAYLNSSLSQSQMEKAVELAAEGRYRFIYVAPERLLTASFIRFSQRAKISMIAVDEAHCVSQWGQDFRPSYLKIADFIQQLPARPPVGAFTATATERVGKDIERLLGLDHPEHITTGFDRPNLFYEIINVQKRADVLIRLVQAHDHESGIIYCNSRKQVEEITEKLNHAGIPATRYHAGLSDEERKLNQEDFQYDRVRVMVATNAFGMGIDKSNVRYVFHAQMPRSIEAYYQEIGRAGRDGEPAECILLYSRQDIIISRYLIENSVPNETLTDQERDTVRRQEYWRLNQMIDLCEGDQCIRAGMLRYFGQPMAGPCGGCSRCAGSRVKEMIKRVSSVPKQHPDVLPVPVEDLSQDALDDLIVRLKACRLRLANKEHMPAYIICDDKTLRNMAQARPADMAGMSAIKGMGEIKVQKYGQAFLEAIAGWTQIHPELAGETQHLQDDIEKGLLRSPSGEEQALLQRCLKAKLSIKQMTIILDQPSDVVESWLKQPIS